MVMIYLLAMLAVAAASHVSKSGMEVSVHSSLTFEEVKKRPTERPMSQVIKLLKDMQATMEKEGEADQEGYDKMACWCITNKKEKAKSVVDSNTHIFDLNTRIEEQSASMARLGAEIDNLNKEVAEDQTTLDAATELRKKQLAEFNAEEKDLLASVLSLKGAVTVLEKSNSFLQSPREVRDLMQTTLIKQSSQLTYALTAKQNTALTAFIQNGSPSGEIVGILQQMKDIFKKNLNDSQTEESTNVKAFQDLKTAKEDDIKTGQDHADSKAEKLATTKDQISQDTQDLSDTKKSLENDEKFLTTLKEQCETNDVDWGRRHKSRSDEILAVSQALSVLTSDDAHDLFSKTLGFLQTECVANHQKMAANSASKFISSLALRHQSPRLATLAIKVRLNAFTAVKKAIDEMVVQLNKEKADEIKQKTFCSKSRYLVKSREKEDLTAKFKILSASMKRLAEESKALNDDVAAMQSQLTKAGEDRSIENKAFQLTVADQRATQKLLSSALQVLKGFYAKSAAAGTALVETSTETDTKTETAKTPAVLGMITQILNDAKAMEAEASSDEKDAQKAYATLVKATNDSLAAKNKEVLFKFSTAAEVSSKKEMSDVDLELEMLANAKAEFGQSCDWLHANFDSRQKAKDDEVDALGKAKGLLSGARFSS